MLWAILAILSAIGFAICNILDKFILEKKIKNFLAYFLAGGLIWLFFGVIILSVSSFSLPQISPPIILLGILTGVLTGITWLLFYKAITQEEVSRVISLYYIFPIFVAILARILLKEEISSLKWIAIFLTVLGAMIISLKRRAERIRLSNVFLVVLGASFVEAILEIFDKYILYQISVPHLFVLSSFGYFTLALVLFILTPFKKDVREVFFNFSIFKPVLLVHVIYFLASLSFLFAVALTQITYVSALTTSQPLFVFIFALILSLYYPHILEEKLDKRVVLIKTISIILIVSGVLIIILT